MPNGLELGVTFFHGNYNGTLTSAETTTNTTTVSASNSTNSTTINTSNNTTGTSGSGGYSY